MKENPSGSWLAWTLTILAALIGIGLGLALFKLD
jgi:hypothetical protein